MPEKGKDPREVEAFIQLTEETPEQTAQAAKIIEEIGGRPLHTYPPGMIIASIPLDQIRTLTAKFLIASIDLKEIEEGRIERATADIAFAMAAWNKHFLRQAAYDPTRAQDPPETQGKS